MKDSIKGKINFKDFTNKYSLNKTLRFQLRPIGKTKENINKKGLLKEDEDLAKKYKDAKKIMDEYHKFFIDRELRDFTFDEEKLQEFYKIYTQLKKNKNNKDMRKNLQKQQKMLRIEVAKKLKNDKIFKKDFINNILPNWLKEHPIQLDGIENPQDIISDFEQRTTYFNGFYENRENIYTSKPHSTSIGHRLIHENLPRFLDNIDRYKKAKMLGVNFSRVETDFEVDLDNFFTPKGFNQYLTQSDIDQYNKIRGGYSKENNKKQQGINEIINLHAQKIPLREQKKNIRSCQLEELYKQILSDRSEISFRLDDIADDATLCHQIDSMYRIDENEDIISRYNGVDINITRKFQELLDAFDNTDQKKIYIKNDNSMTHISKYLFGDWSKIKDCLDYYAREKLFPTPEDKKETNKLKQEREKWVDKRTYHSFHDIHEALEIYFKQYKDDELSSETDIREQKEIAANSPLIEYFKRKTIKKRSDKDIFETKELFEEIKRTYKKAVLVLRKYKRIEDEKLKNEENEVQVIKHYLDSLMDLQGFLRPLHLLFKEDKDMEIYEKDGGFYSKFEELYEVVGQIISLYNQTRNYLTKRPYSVEKYKLNFENQLLADGWDKNKEGEKGCVLFMKERDYFLGIINKENKNIFQGSLPCDGECFKKMEYKLLPDPKKMLPKVFFGEKNIVTYAPSKEIKDIRNRSSHTKSGDPKEGFEKEEFDLKKMRKMIDFFKESIEKHNDWRQFNFQFSETECYDNLNDFYQEVKCQGYKITFRDISVNYLNQCVERGQLYLFQIYSKDFSSKTRGKPNLQTLYWKELFDEKNLQDVIYKLDGKAELFYRKHSIEYSKEIWNKGHHQNDPKKKQSYPIIKDRRYAKDTFLFHVPITCNFKKDKLKSSDFNDEVNDYIKENSEIKVIGIDRGERNLAYYTLMDGKGEILKQESLNKIGGKDYHRLLSEREKKRDQARKSWGTIRKIKSLKEGYLSQVVHKIATLMVENNAIVIFEDLNSGFKNSRFKIERQIYQKLEKMLIDKLNFLVFKDCNVDDVGGVSKALQLTAPFESFKKLELDKQTGFIFYVSPYHTSKICPATGFVNLLYPKYETIDKTRDFFNSFDKISFNNDEKYFQFHFNYKEFTDKATGGKPDWVICSHGMRLENFRNTDKNNKWDTREVDLTKEIKKILEDYSIEYPSRKCLIKQICKQNKSDFFKSLIRLLKLTLQIRNSRTGTDEDWLISPVKNNKDIFFDSRKSDFSMPENADANGAYHIGLKGLLMIKQIRKGTNRPDLSHKVWYDFVQKRDRIE